MANTECANEAGQSTQLQRFLAGTSLDGLRGPVGELGGGNLNNCFVYEQGRGRKTNLVVVRFPKIAAARAVTCSDIKREFDAFGATEAGITFDVRTTGEQASLMRQTTEAGLPMPRCLDVVGNVMAMEYVNGLTLDRYLQQEPEQINPTVIEGVLIRVHDAHKHGIVIGDRWGANTKVDNDKHKEFDFDIQLGGDLNKTAPFELAQYLFHMVHFSFGHRDFITNTILDIYARNPQLYEGYTLKTLRTFLTNQSDYFYGKYQMGGSLYEGLIPPSNEVYQLINGMEEIKRFQNQLIMSGTTLYEAA